MIRVSVMYPTAAGKKFDHAYYAKTHMALVHARLDSLGLRRTEVDKGLGGGAPGVLPTRTQHDVNPGNQTQSP